MSKSFHPLLSSFKCPVQSNVLKYLKTQIHATRIIGAFHCCHPHTSKKATTNTVTCHKRSNLSCSVIAIEVTHNFRLQMDTGYTIRMRGKRNVRNWLSYSCNLAILAK